MFALFLQTRGGLPQLAALALALVLGSGGNARGEEPRPAAAGAAPRVEPVAAGPVPPAEFFRGNYLLIGRKPDGGAAYVGRVSLREEEGGGLAVTRRIGGRAVRGSARFETATADRIPVLRMRFVFDGRRCEGTYLWQTDLDNYSRLTGYVYRLDGKTRSPGLEALFPARN